MDFTFINSENIYAFLLMTFIYDNHFLRKQCRSVSVAAHGFS